MILKRSIQLPALVLLAAMLYGCSPYRSRVPDVPVKMPERFSESISDSPASFAGRWWKRFNDEGLNAIMDEAFLNNLDIAQAYERLNQARAVVRTAKSSQGPQLNINAQAARSRQSGFSALSSGATTGVFLPGSTFTSYRLSAGAGYEMDLWRRLASATRAARLDASASREDLKSIYISVSAQLADLYYLAIEERAQLELSERTIEAFKDTLERVEGRYRAGIVPALDVYQSRQNLALARAQRPLFEADLSVTEHAISVILGRFPGKGLSGRSMTLPEAPDFPEGLPSGLLTRRPDIEAALSRVKAGDKRVAAAVADRFPAFNLIGEYGGASLRLADLLDSPNIFWNLIVEAAMPVIDSGRRRAEVKRSKAALMESMAVYRKTVLVAFKEVEDAISRGRAAERRVSLLKERSGASEDALRLALDNYMQGLSDYLPVLTGQQRLYDAERELITAKRQLISDRIELARALGGTWAEEVAGKRIAGNLEEEEDR